MRLLWCTVGLKQLYDVTHTHSHTTSTHSHTHTQQTTHSHTHTHTHNKHTPHSALNNARHKLLADVFYGGSPGGGSVVDNVQQENYQLETLELTGLVVVAIIDCSIACSRLLYLMFSPHTQEIREPSESNVCSSL